MKKQILLMAALAVMTVTAVNAQTRIEGANYKPFGFIPAELTYNHTALMVFDISENHDAIIVDQNLNVQQTVTGHWWFWYYDSERLTGGVTAISSYSQTLFNNDADYEYIDCSPDAITIKKINGTILHTINPDAGFEMDAGAIVKFNDKYYLVTIMGQEDPETHFTNNSYGWYHIDRPSQKITRVEGDIHLNVFPSVADRDQTITVELGEGNNATEVQVVNAVGQVVKSIAVQPGQREVQLRASDLGSGMHIVGTRSRKDQGACKIIVK